MKSNDCPTLARLLLVTRGVKRLQTHSNVFGHVRREPGSGKDEHSGFGPCKLTRTSLSRDDSKGRAFLSGGRERTRDAKCGGLSRSETPQAGQRPQSAPGPSPELFLRPEGKRTRPAHAQPRSGRRGPAETPEDGGGAPRQHGPSRPAGSTPVRQRERAASPHPHAGRAGQALHGVSAPTPNEAGPSHQARAPYMAAQSFKNVSGHRKWKLPFSQGLDSETGTVISAIVYWSKQLQSPTRFKERSQ